MKTKIRWSPQMTDFSRNSWLKSTRPKWIGESILVADQNAIEAVYCIHNYQTCIVRHGPTDNKYTLNIVQTVCRDVLLQISVIMLHCILQLEVIDSTMPIKSIELQLIRVETCGCAEGYARDGMCVLFQLLHTQYTFQSPTYSYANFLDENSLFKVIFSGWHCIFFINSFEWWLMQLVACWLPMLHVSH